jgi:vacuolar-type H+-ATPase subunit I/STV1
LKEREIKLSNEKIAHLEKTERDLRRDAKESLARWQAKESEYNSLIKSQTDNMEKARKREIEELQNIHNNKINSYKHQIKELERHIEEKNKVINGLKSQYEDLVNRFEEVFSQRAAQKNLDVKIPGWIPDTIATKNVFDVFLKNKVL